MGTRRQQLHHMLGKALQIHWSGLDRQLAGFGAREVQKLVNEQQQRFARGFQRPHIGSLLMGEMRVGQERRHAQNAVERRAHLMADGSQKAGLGFAGAFGILAGGQKLLFHLAPCGHITQNGLQHRRSTRPFAHCHVDTGEPARPLTGVEQDVPEDPGGFCAQQILRRFRQGQLQLFAGARALLRPEQASSGGIGVDDVLFHVTADDHIAQRMENAGMALVGFTQLPGGIFQLFDALVQPVGFHRCGAECGLQAVAVVMDHTGDRKPASGKTEGQCQEPLIWAAAKQQKAAISARMPIPAASVRTRS